MLAGEGIRSRDSLSRMNGLLSGLREDGEVWGWMWGCLCPGPSAAHSLLCMSHWGLMTATSLGQLVMKKVGISSEARGQDGNHLLVAREPRTRPLQAAVSSLGI